MKLNKKMQQDLTQLRQELKSIHMRYDALQIEMLAMHKANNNDVSLIPTKDTSEKEWSSQRVGDRVFVSMKKFDRVMFFFEV